MEEELEPLKKNHMWTLVDLLKNKKKVVGHK